MVRELGSHLFSLSNYEYPMTESQCDLSVSLLSQAQSLKCNLTIQVQFKFIRNASKKV